MTSGPVSCVTASTLHVPIEKELGIVPPENFVFVVRAGAAEETFYGRVNDGN